MRARLPPGWQASLGAVDGAVTADVASQLGRVPREATHLVVRVGGNDALRQEPVLGGAGCIPPTDGYLQGLQEFAKKNGSLFILDEIVTGFRLSLHGAMSKYKLEPNLFTLGKICGGGMPIYWPGTTGREASRGA